MLSFLTFSDGAKFALIARNLFLGNGFVTDFSFWGSSLFSTSGISPLVPYSMLPFFWLFGVGDFAVIASSFFYFLLLVGVVFLLGRRLFGNLVGVLSALAVAANPNVIDYATSGASEPLFMFLIVLSAYLFILGKKVSTSFGFLALVLMYFTRPQAIIFIAALVLLWLVLRFGVKRAFVYFFGLGALGYLADRFIIYPLSFKYPLTPVFMRGLQGILTYSSHTAVSDALRGAPSSTLAFSDIAKKVFYNLYNFYKLLPQIVNPYLAAFFAVGLFVKEKTEEVRAFRVAAVFMVAVTLLVAALTIPFFRYLHPVVPFVYILATAAIVSVVGGLVKDYKLSGKKRSQIQIIVSLVLVLFFAVGQTLGIILLDSRFERNTKNAGKPPVYAALAYKLKEVTDEEDVIITNLDTWGSWYGERKTVWFPLEPEMLVNPQTGEVPFDAIYLTSYRIDDENYHMGEGWREAFFEPLSLKKGVIPENFVFKGEYEVSAPEVYENQDARAVLWVKRTSD